MKNLNQNYETYENLSNTERAARLIVSAIAIVAAMSSSIAGTTLFSVICLLGITLAMTSIIGWDPVRAISNKTANEKVKSDHHHGHTA